MEMNDQGALQAVCYGVRKENDFFKDKKTTGRLEVEEILGDTPNQGFQGGKEVVIFT